MPRYRTIIDAPAHRTRLDDAVAAVRREADGAAADPFDEAMMAAVFGIAEALKAETDALADLEKRMGKLGRL